MAKPWRKVITRREFLGGAAGVSLGLAAAACGPAQPGAQAPAVQPRPTELHVLRWSSFVAEMDKLIDTQMQEWGKKNNVNVKVEHINANDIPARLAAAVQAKAGPDIIQFWDGWPWIYEDSLVDVSKEVEELIKKLNGVYQDFEAYCKVNGVWRAFPYSYTTNTFIYRTDYFKEAGVSVPKTWDEFIEAGKKLKAYGKPIG
jgi:multiple sugar transport system substrate-binding protein